MTPEIAEIYGNKVRLRVCGLCWEGDSLLLVKHQMGNGYLWAPPGGGVEYQELLEDALKREFIEETGLKINVEKFLFGCEFIKNPLHAVELFFDTKKVGGTLMSGYDPELQLIENAVFLSWDQIKEIPERFVHGIINKCQNYYDLRQLSGFYSI
jgi:8-oxo-dGTP diphosphatase